MLILVWVVLARKYSGKGSAHQRSVELIAEQNALLGKQLAAIESIATAASKSSKAGEV